MAQTLDATFDGRVIRLGKPLDLPANTRVRLTLEPSEPDSEPGAFIRAALNLAIPGPSDGSIAMDDYLYHGKPFPDE